MGLLEARLPRSVTVGEPSARALDLLGGGRPDGAQHGAAERRAGASCAVVRLKLTPGICASRSSRGSNSARRTVSTGMKRPVGAAAIRRSSPRASTSSSAARAPAVAPGSRRLSTLTAMSTTGRSVISGRPRRSRIGARRGQSTLVPSRVLAFSLGMHVAVAPAHAPRVRLFPRRDACRVLEGPEARNVPADAHTCGGRRAVGAWLSTSRVRSRRRARDESRQAA